MRPKSAVEESQQQELEGESHKAIAPAAAARAASNGVDAGHLRTLLILPDALLPLPIDKVNSCGPCRRVAKSRRGAAPDRESGVNRRTNEPRTLEPEFSEDGPATNATTASGPSSSTGAVADRRQTSCSGARPVEAALSVPQSIRHRSHPLRELTGD